MLANFFGKSNPVNFLIIFLLFLGLFSIAFFSILPWGSVNSDLLVDGLSIIGIFVLLFFFFNFILAKNKLTLFNSYGFLFFVLLFGFFPSTFFDRHELIVNLLILIFLRRVYSLRSPKSVYKKLIDSGFWLGILFMIEPFTILFGTLIFIATLLFQSLNFRTLLIPIVGFIIPVFCYFSYCFWYDQVEQFEALFLWYTDYDFSMYKQGALAISIGFISILTVFSILFKTPKVFLISGSYRKYWTLILINLLIGILMIVFSNNTNGSEFTYVFFPVAVILANGVEGIKRKFLKDILLAICILFPVVLLII